jgi:hypothetical protein
LARANFEALKAKARHKYLPHIPEYMDAPKVFEKYGYLISIWRTKLVPLTRNDWRHCAGILKFKDLRTQLSLGLHWWYSFNWRKVWREYKYVLYSWFPGKQPCKDLRDVYRSTTFEIDWVIERLQDNEARILKSKRRDAVND